MTVAAVLPWVLNLFVFLAFAYLASVLLMEFGERGELLARAQVDSGESTLAELYVALSPEAFFALRLVAALFFFVLGFFAVNFWLGVMLAGAAYLVPSFYLKQLREKRVHLVERQLVEGLELLGNSLKSGLTLQQAVELLVREFPPPIKQEFALVLAESRLGVDFNDALMNMASRLGSNVVQILAVGVAITKRVGGDLTVIFGNIAATIREQANIEGKLNAVTAQGRFQGLVLGLMPFALMILLFFVDRGHVETLFGYRIGLFAVATVVVMVIFAQVWIRKLLDIDV